MAKPKTYQLVLQFPCDDLHDYDWMIDFEELLDELLVGDSDVDGHDAGSGEMNIYIHSPRPEQTFQKISTLLQPHLNSLKAAYRDFAIANTDADWVILFPAELQNFSIV